MSGGLNAKFIQQKADFLNDHFLMFLQGLALLAGKGIYDFDIKEDKATKITASDGRAVKACILQPIGSRGKEVGRSTNAISAYYLPFDANRGFSHRLVEDVDFCFTPTLNGCTFAVGSGPTPLVSHYNFVDDNAAIDQGKIDRHLDNRFKHGFTALRRNDYKNGTAAEYKVTIVGIREGDGWHFYYQRRSQDLVFVPGEGSSLVTIANNMSVRLT